MNSATRTVKPAGVVRFAATEVAQLTGKPLVWRERLPATAVTMIYATMPASRSAASAQ